MISFSCSCGKTYQLPDRHAGREVRCNQCHRALIVPKESQTEPIVPVDDQTEKQPVPNANDEQTGPKRLHPVLPIATVAVIALVVGVVLGKIIFHPPVKSDTEAIVEATSNSKISEELKVSAGAVQQVVDEHLGGLKERLTTPASQVVGVVSQADDAKRVEEMKKIADARQEDLRRFGVFETQQRAVGILNHLADYFENPEGRSVDFSLFTATEEPRLTAKDWRTGDTIPTRFAVKTLDGEPALLSLDADPVAAAKAEKGPNVLDVVADAVKTDAEKAAGDVSHGQSFRIDSASREELRLIWPDHGSTALSGEKVKEFRFFLYIPVKPNAVFKPGKPEGIDRTLALSSIRLRLVADNGFIEYAPADNEKFVHLIERCRSDWLPVVVPIQGNENWKRSDFGLSGPLVIERIELRAKPTGSGVTFWVDNLAVVE